MNVPFKILHDNTLKNNVLCKYEGFEGFPGIFLFK